ncbi:putative ribonuclease H-like domain-containing protein [Tanacetum coccineum]|uniref:Ribonuclease H-like domain-containing protein n=1 Tax=Tanacetum coccineum TaxID=301880 RepID=A0ABQ4X9T7_9ASTR
MHQAPRAWYETLSTYLLDNGFHRGMIDKTLFIKRDKSDIMLVQVYVDDIIFGSTRKEMCLQVKQKEDGIFISQDKYVNRILNKFGFSDVKTASTPMETHKTLLKDEKVEDVDEHLYRSMIGAFMYLTSSRPDIMFAVCQPKLGLWYPKDSPFDLVAYTDSDYAGASLDRKSTIGGCQFLGCSGNAAKDGIGVKTGKSRVNADGRNLVLLGKIWSTTEIKIVNNETQIHAMVEGKRIVIPESYVRRDLQFDDENEVNAVYDTPSHTNKIFANMRRQGKDFSGTVTPLFSSMLAQQADMGEGSRQPTNPQHTSTSAQPSNKEPITIPSSSQPKNTFKHKAVHKERGDSVERDATTATSLDAEQDSGGRPRVLTLETTKTAQAKEIANLKNRVKKLERKRTSRTPRMNLFKIGTSRRRSLGEEDASKQGRNLKQGKQIFKESDFDDEDEVSTSDVVNIVGTEVNTASAPVTTIGISVSTAEPITTVSEVVTTVEPSTPPTTTTTNFEDEDLTIA